MLEVSIGSQVPHISLSNLFYNNLLVMDIKKKDLAFPPKQIGFVDSNPVYEMATKGGLYVVAMTKSGKTETLAIGPHKAIARHIAQKTEPKFRLTELNKAEYVPLEVLTPYLAKYEALTERIRKLN